MTTNRKHARGLLRIQDEPPVYVEYTNDSQREALMTLLRAANTERPTPSQSAVKALTTTNINVPTPE